MHSLESRLKAGWEIRTTGCRETWFGSSSLSTDTHQIDVWLQKSETLWRSIWLLHCTRTDAVVLPPEAARMFQTPQANDLPGLAEMPWLLERKRSQNCWAYCYRGQTGNRIPRALPSFSWSKKPPSYLVIWSYSGCCRGFWALGFGPLNATLWYGRGSASLYKGVRKFIPNIEGCRSCTRFEACAISADGGGVQGWVQSFARQACAQRVMKIVGRILYFRMRSFVLIWRYLILWPRRGLTSGIYPARFMLNTLEWHCYSLAVEPSRVIFDSRILNCLAHAKSDLLGAIDKNTIN